MSTNRQVLSPVGLLIKAQLSSMHIAGLDADKHGLGLHTSCFASRKNTVRPHSFDVKSYRWTEAYHRRRGTGARVDSSMFSRLPPTMGTDGLSVWNALP